MSHPLYTSKLEALENFVDHNWNYYLDNQQLDVKNMFKDFNSNLRTTLGDLYYLQCEEL